MRCRQSRIRPSFQLFGSRRSGKRCCTSRGPNKSLRCSDHHRIEDWGEGQGKICDPRSRSYCGEGKNRTANHLRTSRPRGDCRRRPLPGIAQAIVDYAVLLSQSRLGRCFRGDRIVSVGRAQFWYCRPTRFISDTDTGFPGKRSTCRLERDFCRGDEVGYFAAG